MRFTGEFKKKFALEKNVLYLYRKFQTMEQAESEKILFPYDFSPESNHAMQYLVGLTKIFNYSVEFLNILDPGTKKYMQEHKLTKQELTEKFAKLAQEFQAKNNIPISYLLKNAPIKRLRKLSEKEEVSFTFLAINEPEKMAAKIMKVVTTSPVPAFVVQNGVDFKPVKNILFPIDDSYTSRQKAGWALRFARKTNAKIHIFPMNPAALIKPEKEKKQRTVIDSVEWFFAKNHVEYVTELSSVIYDEFDNDIIKYSKNANIDLIIIMIPPVKLFRPITKDDFRIIFNSVKIPVFCVNERNLFLGGGIS
jgi:nucleotide-binding universal stress UspA family protein